MINYFLYGRVGKSWEKEKIILFSTAALCLDDTKYQGLRSPWGNFLLSNPFHIHPYQNFFNFFLLSRPDICKILFLQNYEIMNKP